MEDYFYLCLNCGKITPYSTWTFWQYNYEDDENFSSLWPVDGWRPSNPGEGDPMCRCPACGWEHRDEDGNPGIMDGTRLEVERFRRDADDAYKESWVEIPG